MASAHPRVKLGSAVPLLLGGSRMGGQGEQRAGDEEGCGLLSGERSWGWVRRTRGRGRRQHIDLNSV